MVKINPIEQVLKTVRNFDMLNPGDRVLAAVSGGSDSIFMLHALVSLKKKLRLGEISVAHLDHGLRGADSRQDAIFVKAVAEDAGLNFFHKKISLNRRKKQDISTEEVARQERYLFFREAAEASKSGVIATGHTLDDHAETVLMRIIKGTSFKGMLGVLPVRQEGALHVIRPIIELEKDEIARYLNERSMRYRTDLSNFKPIYFRNIIRGEVMPFLSRYNPRLKRSLFSLSEHLREDFSFIEEAKERAKEALSVVSGRVELHLKTLVVQPSALQKEIIRDALEKAGGTIKRLTFRHWKDVESFIKHKRKGDSLDLPGGVRITRTENTIQFRKI